MTTKQVIEEIDAHAWHREEVSALTNTILANDLAGLFIQHAQEALRLDLERIADMMYWTIPAACWGSSEAIERWRCRQPNAREQAVLERMRAEGEHARAAIEAHAAREAQP